MKLVIEKDMTIPAEGIRRLNLLKTYLIENEEKIFPRLNLAQWRAFNINKKLVSLKQFTPNDTQLKNDCDTVGCILGWASSNKTFKNLGLSFKNGFITYFNPETKRTHLGFDAACQFFMIPNLVYVYMLLTKSGYDGCQTPTLQQVVANIDNLIKESTKNAD